MITKTIFLASSAELKDDREAFERYIGRRNKDWVDKGVFLRLVHWEDFLDAMSRTRLQDEYNRAARECEIFVMLYGTKAGPYTEEEFEAAFGQFKATGKPFVYTYFKDAPITTGSADRKALASLWAFQDKLKALGHFQTTYRNVEGLQLHFSQQLDKLVANGFIEFEREAGEARAATVRYSAKVEGSGAIAQSGGTALGAGSVQIVGANSGNINAGTQRAIDLGAPRKAKGTESFAMPSDSIDPTTRSRRCDSKSPNCRPRSRRKSAAPVRPRKAAVRPSVQARRRSAATTSAPSSQSRRSSTTIWPRAARS